MNSHIVCSLSRGVSLCPFVHSGLLVHLIAISLTELKVTVEGWEDDPQAMCLDPQNPRKIHVGVATSLWSQGTRRQRWGIPEASWLSRLARVESSWFKWETLSQNIRQRVTKEDICTYVHVYTHACIYYIHMQKESKLVWGAIWLQEFPGVLEDTPRKESSTKARAYFFMMSILSFSQCNCISPFLVIWTNK